MKIAGAGSMRATNAAINLSAGASSSTSKRRGARRYAVEKPTPKIYVEGDAVKRLCLFMREMDDAVHGLCSQIAHESTARLGLRWAALKAKIEEILKVEREETSDGQ